MKEKYCTEIRKIKAITYMMICMMCVLYCFISVETVNASGNLEYLVEGNVAVITGYTDYDGNSKVLKIPEKIDGYTVGKISSIAFMDCTSFTEVIIPKSVTSIGDYAFCDCVLLEKITISSGVKHIGTGVFMGCSSLKKVTIPDSVTYLGEQAFWDCSSLTDVVISKNINKIHERTFQDCVLLKKITIPENVTYIGDSAFEDCSSLTEIKMSEKVTYIGDRAFCGCENLKKVAIPKNTTQIGEQAFSECKALKEIKIPNSVTHIGDFCFYNCTSLGKAIIPNKVTYIGDYAFYGCQNIKIYCPKDSKAHIYAQNNRISYILDSVIMIFSDIHDDWYTDYVQYVYDYKLMTGIKGTNRFEPNSNITKAQVAQVLYNMENQPKVGDRKVFAELKDVYQAEWYANAVAWAYNTGVVTGDINAKKFFPNANVTREQLALMLFRYAEYKNYDVSACRELTEFRDGWRTNSWALDSVKWAVGQGVISGVEKNSVKYLEPQGNATRAQMAAILQRFCERYGR